MRARHLETQGRLREYLEELTTQGRSNGGPRSEKDRGTRMEDGGRIEGGSREYQVIEGGSGEDQGRIEGGSREDQGRIE